MTVGQLREILEGFEDEREVRLAIQPSWPFEHEIGEVAETDETGGMYVVSDPDDAGGWVVMRDGRNGEVEMVNGGFDDMEAAEAWIAEEAGEPVVYIAEAMQLAYLPYAAKTALGW